MSTQTSTDTTQQAPRSTGLAMRLEVVVVPVTDVERAKAFYESLDWRFDGEIVDGSYHLVQYTPTGSAASIIFGKGVTADEPGSVDSVILAVDDIDAAREELLSRDVAVSELFHDAAGGVIGGFHPRTEGRATGRDPEGRSYGTYASFTDPDGNMFVLQEITERAPGRV